MLPTFEQVKQQLMLPQLTNGVIETAFNYLIGRSDVNLALAKLAGKVLKVVVTEPDRVFFIVFGQTSTTWLSQYEGQEDCAVQLKADILPKLSDKKKLTELINNQSLVLTGDIEVLQHFTALLAQLEKDPAELLSRYTGDVVAQASVDFIRKGIKTLRSQWQRNSQNLVDNLIQERPVLVHKLAVVDFCDQVTELSQRCEKLAKHIDELLQRRSTKISQDQPALNGEE